MSVICLLGDFLSSFLQFSNARWDNVCGVYQDLMTSYLQFPFACRTNYEIGGRREGKEGEVVVRHGSRRQARKEEEEGAKEDEDEQGAWLLKVKIFFMSTPIYYKIKLILND